MNKQVILPIIAVIALAIKNIAGVQMDDHAQNLIADLILSIVSLYGVFVEPKKPDSSGQSTEK